MSSTTKVSPQLSPFQSTAIRLELLLDCVHNSKSVAEDGDVCKMDLDLIQKDQCQLALTLLQQLRSDFTTHKYSCNQQKKVDEASLQSLTLQVQQFLFRLKPSIKDSIVQPKCTTIRLQDILSLVPKTKEIPHSISFPPHESTPPAAENSTSSNKSTTHQTHERNTTLVFKPQHSRANEKEDISRNLEQDIAQMAQSLKKSTLSIHTSLKQQSNLLNDMETLAQESIDKTKAVSDKVQDHVRKGWIQTFGRWSIFFMIVGSWMFCFLVIRTVPKRHRGSRNTVSPAKLQPKNCKKWWFCRNESSTDINLSILDNDHASSCSSIANPNEVTSCSSSSPSIHDTSSTEGENVPIVLEEDNKRDIDNVDSKASDDEKPYLDEVTSCSSSSIHDTLSTEGENVPIMLEEDNKRDIDNVDSEASDDKKPYLDEVTSCSSSSIHDTLSTEGENVPIMLEEDNKRDIDNVDSEASDDEVPSSWIDHDKNEDDMTEMGDEWGQSDSDEEYVYMDSYDEEFIEDVEHSERLVDDGDSEASDDEVPSSWIDHDKIDDDMTEMGDEWGQSDSDEEYVVQRR